MEEKIDKKRRQKETPEWRKLMLMTVDCTGIVTLLIVNTLNICGFVDNKEVFVLPVNVVLEPILNALILLQRHH